MTVNTIYQFIKPYLDNKMSIFEEYGTFNDEFIIRKFCENFTSMALTYIAI